MPHALLYDAIIPPSQAIAAKSRSGSSKEMPGRRLVDGTFNSRNLNHLNLRGSKLQLFELEFLMESIARDSARLEGGTGVYLGGAHLSALYTYFPLLCPIGKIFIVMGHVRKHCHHN